MASKKSGSGGTRIDPAALARSLGKLEPRLSTLPDDGRPSSAALRKAVKELGTLEARLDDREVGATELALVMLAADALDKGKPTVRRSSHVAEDVEIHLGDLHVKGSFVFAANVFVLGDLVVDDALSEHWHGASLVVAGSIRARGIKSGGRIYSGAGIQAELVFVETSGRIGGPRGITGDLVILEDAKHSHAYGKVAAGNVVTLAYPDRKPLARLRALLAPTSFGCIDQDEGIFDYSVLFQAIYKRTLWAAKGKAAPAKGKAAPAKSKAAPAKKKAGATKRR